jgi:hypothetical protein
MLCLRRHVCYVLDRQRYVEDKCREGKNHLQWKDLHFREERGAHREDFWSRGEVNVMKWKTLRFWGNWRCCNGLIIMVELHTLNENNHSRSASNNMSLEVESSWLLSHVVTQLSQQAKATAPKRPLLKSAKRGRRSTPEHLQAHVVISVVACPIVLKYG